MQKLRDSNMQGFKCKKMQMHMHKIRIESLKIQTCNEGNQIWDSYRFTCWQGFNILSLLNERFSSVFQILIDEKSSLPLTDFLDLPLILLFNGLYLGAMFPDVHGYLLACLDRTQELFFWCWSSRTSDPEKWFDFHFLNLLHLGDVAWLFSQYNFSRRWWSRNSGRN
jgi:hypothetical protein